MACTGETMMQMPTTFPGFSRNVLGFFRDLEKNNEREWFAARKELFEEEIRLPMIELVELLSASFARFAADYVPQRPEKAIYRIYRDTRFQQGQDALQDAHRRELPAPPHREEPWGRVLLRDLAPWRWHRGRSLHARAG